MLYFIFYATLSYTIDWFLEKPIVPLKSVPLFLLDWAPPSLFKFELDMLKEVAEFM
jgi:hypothetical protein